MPDDVITEADILQLRNLLGKWLTHVRGQDRSSALINASELTYAFVNATCDFMGLPPDPNNPKPEIT